MSSEVDEAHHELALNSLVGVVKQAIGLVY